MIQPVQAVTLKDLNQCADYAKPAVGQLAQTGIINGDQNGYFHPQQGITRAQMVTLLVKSLGLDKSITPAHNNSFKDVPANHWANKYVEIAYQTGITKGVGANQFGVNQNCSREQMITLYVNSLKQLDASLTIPSNSVDLSKFTDAAKISAWARDPIAFSVYSGLISGTSQNTMDPQVAAQRQQVAVLTQRFIDKKDTILNDIQAQRILGQAAAAQLNDQGIKNTGDIEVKLELQDEIMDLPAEFSIKAHMINEILWPDKIHQYVKVETVGIPNNDFPLMEMEHYLINGVMYQKLSDENNNAEWEHNPLQNPSEIEDLVQAIKDAQTAQMLLPDEIHKSVNVHLENANVNGTDGYKITYTGTITELSALLDQVMATLPDGTDSSELQEILDEIKATVKSVNFTEIFYVGADHQLYNNQYTMKLEMKDNHDLPIPIKNVTIKGSNEYKYNNFEIVLPPEASSAI